MSDEPSNHQTPFVLDAANTLRDSNRAEERWLGSIIYSYHMASDRSGGQNPLSIMGETALLEFLGTITQYPEFARKQRQMLESGPQEGSVLYSTRLPEDAYAWGALFIYQMLKELRSLICETQTESKTGIVDLKEFKAYPKALGVSLASLVMAKLGVTEPMAMGIATLVLLSLAQATKNAFCASTDEEVIKAIRERREQATRASGPH
jgi:hypothetical protein